MTLTLQYRFNRGEIWRWYWCAWRRPRGLWRFHVLFFGFITNVLLWGRSNSRPVTPADLAVAVAKGLLAVVWMPLWPLIRFQPEERVFSLDHDWKQSWKRSLEQGR